MSILGKISQANGRLKAGRLKVSIVDKNDWLYLRGTFPPKPQSGKSAPYQQWLPTKLPTNPAGLKEAERMAREIGLKLITGSFEWPESEKFQVVGDLIDKFGRSLLADGLSETSWRKEYLSPLTKLGDRPLDPDKLLEEIRERTPSDSRTRRRWCLAIAKLLDFAGVPNDFRKHKGGYSLRSVSPRDLPTDEQIWETWRSLLDVDPLWGNVFGLLAAYGLRNHEAFFCDFSELPLLWVSRGKTGERYVYPIYPEWGDLVSGDLPKISRKDHQGYGSAVTKAFSKFGVAFTPYRLRHRFACRAVECGQEPVLTAKQMGHSLQVHNRVYQHELGRSVHQKAFDNLRDNPARPRPPVM